MFTKNTKYMVDVNKRVRKLVYQGTLHVSIERLKEASQYEGFKGFLQDYKPGDIVLISSSSNLSKEAVTVETYLKYVADEKRCVSIEGNKYATNFPVEMFLPLVEDGDRQGVSERVARIGNYDIY